MTKELPSAAIRRAGIIDDDLIAALQNLMFGDTPLEITDLSKIEMALRGFITAEELHMVPRLLLGADDVGQRRDWADDAIPFHDGVLDFEFVYETKDVDLLAPLTTAESDGIDSFIDHKFKKAFGKPFEALSREEMLKVFEGLSARLSKHANLILKEGDEELYEGGVKSAFLPTVLEYAKTLVRLHRGGAVVFTETAIGKTCHEHIFSQYPRAIFESLDTSWPAYLRKAMGPGIGISVPPVLACVLTNAGGKRHEIMFAIRDLREQYATARQELWDYLEQMWKAPTLKEQLELLADLENASASLFQASFPERFPFLETAWDITADVAELKPLSAVTKIGKSLLGTSKPQTHVSAIGFTRRLARDLRAVAGLDRLLRPYLTKAEAASFGL
jgi:hypothetical protein